MDDTAATTEIQNMLDDEFLVNSDVNEDATSVLERLKEFAYYLVENFEVNLNFCLALLEERTIPAQSNSIHTNVLSKLLSAIPKVGTAVGNALSKGELMIFEKIDKKNSKILADLIYYYSDHKEDIRTLLIQSAVDIFYSFEYQFRRLTCDVGQKKAMQKLAKDASDRIFNYFLETEQTKNVTRTEITKGVLFGDSKRNKRGVREGRTVVIDDNTWKTNKIYKKTGLVIVEEQAFYKNKDTHTEKYGHRRLLPWEELQYVKDNWQRETDLALPNYYLTDVKEDLFKLIRDYIMSKNPNEEAKLERENYNKDAVEDRNVKHEEVLTTFHDKFKELLEDLEHQYKVITDNHNENKELLKEVSAKQDKGEVLHYEISTKLQEIHKDVYDTKVSVETNMTLQQDIAIAKQGEVNTTTTEITTEVVKEIVATETKQAFEGNLKDFIKEKLRKNDPGPKIGKEIKRTLKKLKL